MKRECEIADFESEIREMWAKRSRANRIIDEHAIRHFHFARSLFPHCEEERNRLCWSLSDCLQTMQGTLEDIADASREMYLGRTSVPAVRMFGRPAGLSNTSSMVPHCRNYRYMVVLYATQTEQIEQFESDAIEVMSSWLSERRTLCVLNNRSLGFDGPLVGQVQYFYAVCNFKPGKDLDFGHDLPSEFDNEFVEMIVGTSSEK